MKASCKLLIRIKFISGKRNLLKPMHSIDKNGSSKKIRETFAVTQHTSMVKV